MHLHLHSKQSSVNENCQNLFSLPMKNRFVHLSIVHTITVSLYLRPKNTPHFMRFLNGSELFSKTNQHYFSIYTEVI